MDEEKAEEQDAFLIAVLARLETLASDLDTERIKAEMLAMKLNQRKQEIRDIRSQICGYFEMEKN